jgi:hypothetical protein
MSPKNPQVDDKTFSTVTTGQPHLAKQDLSTLDITKLSPLSPGMSRTCFYNELRMQSTWFWNIFSEVISRQATINIGTIGHVAHGKSTLVKAVSGVHTVR